MCILYSLALFKKKSIALMNNGCSLTTAVHVLKWRIKTPTGTNAVPDKPVVSFNEANIRTSFLWMNRHIASGTDDVPDRTVETSLDQLAGYSRTYSTSHSHGLNFPPASKGHVSFPRRAW